MAPPLSVVEEHEPADTLMSIAVQASLKRELRRIAQNRDETMSGFVRRLLERELAPKSPAIHEETS